MGQSSPQPASDTRADAPTDPLYDGYDVWKGWTNLFAHGAEDAAYFRGETGEFVRPGAQVLEMGFGSGAFMSWARESGATVTGTEINPTLADAARKAGFALIEPAIETVASEHAGRFDVIAAFDVFEHFSIEDVRARLFALDTMLKDGGVAILRFPNGQSPFGALSQNADPTHRSALSREVIEQLMRGTRLSVLRYGPAYRIRGGSPAQAVARRLRYMMRDLISRVLNFVYANTIPWDVVVTIVLCKEAARAAS